MEKLNLCCSIMIVGLVPERGGQIETLVSVYIELEGDALFLLTV